MIATILATTSLLALASLARANPFPRVSSCVQVVSPPSLRKENGYQHISATYGKIPFGGFMELNVAYDSSHTFSQMDKIVRPEIEGPFILMVNVDQDLASDVGSQVVRSAQKAGASAVIFAFEHCMCIAANCQPKPEGGKCYHESPIVDSSNPKGDPLIPALYIYKEDADEIKQYLHGKNATVRMKLSWNLIAPNDRVDYQLWHEPSQSDAYQFIRVFRDIANMFGTKHAKFTPHQYIWDGRSCVGPGGYCARACTNHGRYCSYDRLRGPNPYNGSDAVAESLRRICIWKVYGEDGIGWPWWIYVDDFYRTCDQRHGFTNKTCIEEVMKRSNISPSKIDACMSDSGGLDGDVANSFLEAELSAWKESGIVYTPALSVNSVRLPEVCSVMNGFRAVCAGFAEGSAPDICKNCAHCADPTDCIYEGIPCEADTQIVWGTEMAYAATDSGSTSGHVTVTTFAISMVCIVVAIGSIGAYFITKTRTEARIQARNIVAEYMPLNDGDDSPPLDTAGDAARQDNVVELS